MNNPDTTADFAFAHIHDAVNLVSPSKVKASYASILNQGTISAPQVKKSASSKRVTLDRHKLYLDSAITYHSMFCKCYLTNVCPAGKILCGNFNAGVMSTSTKGQLGTFEMWINKSAIANLLSIPQPEKDCFCVTTDTLPGWVVHTPQGEKIVFLPDTGLCNRIPYIDVYQLKNDDALASIVDRPCKIGRASWSIYRTCR